VQDTCRPHCAARAGAPSCSSLKEAGQTTPWLLRIFNAAEHPTRANTPFITITALIWPACQAAAESDSMKDAMDLVALGGIVRVPYHADAEVCSLLDAWEGHLHSGCGMTRLPAVVIVVL
jgi:hypothetical protein